MRTHSRPHALAAVAAFVLAGYSSAGAQTLDLVDIRGLTPRQVKSASFTLPAAQDVRVEAVGAESTNQMDKCSWVTSMV